MVEMVEVPVPDRCAHQAGTSPPPHTILLVAYLLLAAVDLVRFGGINL